MKTKGCSFKWEDPFFVYFKKHSCPCCGNRLVRQKTSEIIQSDSKEAKEYDFVVADITIKGNMKFMRIVFFCDACQKIFTVKALKQLQKTHG